MKGFAVILILAVSAVAMADKDNDTNETEVIVSPTEAPTEAPSEAPTPAPSEAPTPAPTEAPSQAPTSSPLTFTFALGLDSLDDFDATETTGGVAAALGVDAADVDIQTNFVLSTVMTFASAVPSSTLDSAMSTLAQAFSLSPDAMKYTSSGRRLGSHEGKKLDLSITIPTEQKSAASSAQTTLADPNAVAPALGLAPSDVQVDPIRIHVAVTATVKNTKAVEAPTAEALLDGMKTAAPSKSFAVSVEGGEPATDKEETPVPTTAPTAAPDKEEEDEEEEEEEEEDAAFSAPVPLALTLIAAMATNIAMC